MVLLEITYLLTFCPAAEVGAFQAGGAGKHSRDCPAASRSVLGGQCPAPPYGLAFVQKVLSFSWQFPS